MKQLLTVLLLVSSIWSQAQSTDTIPRLFLGMTLREIKEEHNDMPTDLKGLKPTFGGTYKFIYKGIEIISLIESTDVAKNNKGVFDMRCTEHSFIIDGKDEPVLHELVKSWKFISVKSLNGDDTMVKDNGDTFYRLLITRTKVGKNIDVSYDFYYNKKEG